MMKSILAIVWMVACGALQSQTIYQGNIPCGSVRYFGIPGQSAAIWSVENDTSAGLTYTDLKKNETYLVPVSIIPGSNPVYTGISEELGSLRIDLTRPEVLVMVIQPKGAAQYTMSLPVLPSSEKVPVDYRCFKAHRDLLAPGVNPEDSIYMTIEQKYAVPAIGCTSDDSLAFISAILSPYEGLPVDFRYPADMVKNIEISFVQDYSSVYETGESDISNVSAMWEVYNEIVLVSQDSSILTWVESGYDYTGGAHGNYASYYHMYDLKAAKLLGPEDFFVSGYEPVLEDAINKQLRKDLEVDENTSLSESEGFFVEVVPVTSNMVVSASGITFLYNVYEIAPYAFGSVVIEIPFSSVKSIIEPEGIIERCFMNQ